LYLKKTPLIDQQIAKRHAHESSFSEEWEREWEREGGDK